MKAFQKFLAIILVIHLALMVFSPTNAQPDNQEAADKVLRYSYYPDRSPRLDGVVNLGEWQGATQVPLDKGTLFVMHDATALYMLFDITPDTVASSSDYVNITFDVNGDKLITSGVDIHYSVFLPDHLPCLMYYLGPASWSTCNTSSAKFSAGFGVTPLSTTNHRVYEVGIPLYEVSAIPGSTIRIGVRIESDTPAIHEDNPANFTTDFSNLHEFSLQDPLVRLLILADQNDLEILQPLKEHKDWSGMSAYIQSWQNLDQMYKYQGNDSPERIKMGIARYDWAAETDYVMLVGDADKFPMRYTMTDRATEVAYNRAFYSGDLYYADLYESDRQTLESWDMNQNGYYGELHGETITGTVNIDQVDLNPDIAVGRIPANTQGEIQNYIEKVITYENNAYQADWAKRALSVTTIDWQNYFCQDTETIASSFLSGYSFTKLYQPGNAACPVTDFPTSTTINNTINLGAGFTMYMGHGSDYGWQIPTDEYRYEDLPSLTNTTMPTIMFGMACSTAQYTTDPPYAPYTDVNGVHHTGTNAGETFTSTPPQPAPLQVTDNPRSFAEAVLVESTQGSVAYVGGVTGSQPVGRDLIKSFFEGRIMGALTVGDMWNFMVNRYYQLHPIPASLSSPDWYVVATAHQPWKFHLMGDPSLRIYGVSPIEKADFEGIYTMNHDGWEGGLWLYGTSDNPVEGAPNILGLYLDSSSVLHNVRGYVRTWEYPVSDPTWPDHKLQFYIDFNNTSDPGDDQKFEGFLFTHNKNTMAGMTYWNNTPYGFYASKLAKSSELTAGATPESLALSKTVFLGKYRFEYDGWLTTLRLDALSDVSGQPNIGGVLVFDNGETFSVHGYVRTTTYPIDPDWGPDHKIEFYVDFNHTPGDFSDDQQFDGYLFTHGMKAMAGITWWNGIQFGFKAEKVTDVFLPVIRR